MAHDAPAESATPHAGGGHADTGHDEHSHVSDPLGPVDVQAWGAGLLGTALGLLVAAGLFIASGGI